MITNTAPTETGSNSVPKTMFAMQLAILNELREQTALLAAMNERQCRLERAADDEAARLVVDHQTEALLSLCR